MRRLPNYCEFIKLTKDTSLKASSRGQEVRTITDGPARWLLGTTGVQSLEPMSRLKEGKDFTKLLFILYLWATAYAYPLTHTHTSCTYMHT